MNRTIFLNIEIGDGYIVDNFCDAGEIGSVFHASKQGEIQDERAVKFIRHNDLRPTWQYEINKVTKLGTTEGVVPYLGHGDVVVGGEQYRWIAWRFIKGKSLRNYIVEKRITLPILCDVIKRVLAVLHACQAVDIEHGDLHAGNILIEDPNPLHIDIEFQRVWITDFGYLSNSMGKEMLDDFIGLNRILIACLENIDFHFLEGKDKFIHSKLKRDFTKKIAETNPLEGHYVRNPRKLRDELNLLLQGADGQGVSLERHVGDYLAAEVLGNRYDEWKELFVPSIMGVEKLLSKNIAVLTGLRGCGKTTIFRRLTALYDVKLGPSNVPNSGEFLGFYYNARNLAEAFPWLPENKVDVARPRIIHYFNCCWSIEILDWIWNLENVHHAHKWLVPFFKEIFEDKFIVTKAKETGIHHLRSFLTKERERSRLSTNYETDSFWPLSKIDFLERFVEACKINVSSASDKLFYFWLDDYSTPLVTHHLQEIINAVIFKRSANVIFKIATESVESIELIGLHGKVLEQDDDFVLIDLGTEAIQRTSEENRAIIITLLEPRILRDNALREKKITIEQILGHTDYSYNDLSLKLRKDTSHKKEKVKYHGLETFCDLWSSSTRELIILFAEMVESSRTIINAFTEGSEIPIVKISEQDKYIRNAGSRFRSLLAAASNPTRKTYELSVSDKSFGEHLQKIVDYFCDISDFELQTKNSSNEGRTPPKQARRIEITTLNDSIPDEIFPYYKAIIRYGVFIRDLRGKSARGKAVPRLVLRSILIPYYTLSFSKRDNIMMTWEQFCRFLKEPQKFAEDWKKAGKTPKEESLLFGFDK